MKMKKEFAEGCEAGLQEAIAVAGSQLALAEVVSKAGVKKINRRTVQNWTLSGLPHHKRETRQAKVPIAYVHTVSRVTGVSKERLRPDIFQSNAEGAYNLTFLELEYGPSAHSWTLGGSIADRRHYCKGSYTLESGALQARQSYPQTNEAADRGIALHAVMEWLTKMYTYA